MTALFIALFVGLVGIGLVASIIVLATLAIAGVKTLNAAHSGTHWIVDHWRHHRIR